MSELPAPFFTKRVRIVSDGTSNGTKVTDADTGAEIAVSRIEWSMEAPNLAVIKLTCNAAVCDIVGLAEMPRLRWEAWSQRFRKEWGRWFVHWHRFGDGNGLKSMWGHVHNGVARCANRESTYISKKRPPLKKFLLDPKEYIVRNFGKVSYRTISAAVSRYREAGYSLVEGDGWLDEKDNEWNVPAGTSEAHGNP